MVGVGSAGSVELLEREADIPRHRGLSFGIGLLDWAVASEPALLYAALSASPALLSVSFGDDLSWVERARTAGIVPATQVFDVAGARRAESAGIEVLVARGAEGGGHGEVKVGTLPLLEAVLEAVSIPVLAAGGISSARGLAAVLAAGASGAWLGTSFAACPESLAPDWTRDALVRAVETDTVTTRVFDIAIGHPWPPHLPERVLRNGFTDRWWGREEEVASNAEARRALSDAIALGDHQVACVNAGQGVGLLTMVRPAAEVVEQFCAGASQLLSAWAPPLANPRK
jgi:nitronate monooxygenase